MIRRALIIYCDNTASGVLTGPSHDNANYRDYLTRNIGGNWYDDEIISLPNPTSLMVQNYIHHFLNGADYSFIVFTGHGGINTHNNKQYLELMDGEIQLLQLKTNAKRQTIIVDACRGYYTAIDEDLRESRMMSFITGAPLQSTRKIFDDAVLRSDAGWTILYAASESQTALDTNKGAVYLISLLKATYQWEATDRKYNILGLNIAHDMAVIYMNDNYETIQEPTMNAEKRITHYPFAVKFT